MKEKREISDPIEILSEADRILENYKREESGRVWSVIVESEGEGERIRKEGMVTRIRKDGLTQKEAEFVAWGLRETYFVSTKVVKTDEIQGNGSESSENSLDDDSFEKGEIPGDPDQNVAKV